MLTFPEHIVNLARAVLAGEHCEYALSDALEEMGLTHCARHFDNPSPSYHTQNLRDCQVCQIIIGKRVVEGIDLLGRGWEPIADELESYKQKNGY